MLIAFVLQNIIKLSYPESYARHIVISNFNETLQLHITKTL